MGATGAEVVDAPELAPDATTIGGEEDGVAQRIRTVWSVWKRPLLIGLGVTVTLRLVTEWIVLNAVYGVKFPHEVAHDPRVLFNVFNHWDAGYYLLIAQHGYPAGHVAGVAAGQLPRPIAFGPLYPAIVALVHAITGVGVVPVGQLVSFAALVIGAAGLVQLAGNDGTRLGGTSVTLLVAFPTAFFLLSDYPDSLALALGVWSFIAVRNRLWLLAGLAATGAILTKFFLVILVVALVAEVWSLLAADHGRLWNRKSALAVFGVVGPPVVALAAWMVFCANRYGDPLAFVHAQADWQRHVAWPWQLVAHTAGDLVHLRFLDTSTASIMELFDTVTLVLLAVATVVAFRSVRRSYGVLLVLGLATFSFQNMLYNDTREVLALFPFFIVAARLVDGHPWRERVVLACMLPAGYFLITRFATGSFAG